MNYFDLKFRADFLGPVQNMKINISFVTVQVSRIYFFPFQRILQELLACDFSLLTSSTTSIGTFAARNQEPKVLHGKRSAVVSIESTDSAVIAENLLDSIVAISSQLILKSSRQRTVY